MLTVLQMKRKQFHRARIAGEKMNEVKSCGSLQVGNTHFSVGCFH